MQRTPGAYVYYPKEKNAALTEESGNDDDESREPDMEPKRYCSPTRMGIGIFLLSVVSFVIVDSFTNGYMREGIGVFLEWMERHPREGILVFLLVYCVATICLIPASLLTLGSGFVFGCAFGLGLGTVIGTLAVLIGASLGGLVSFLMARYLLREAILRWSQKYTVLQALECTIRDNGLKIFVLLRLSPVAPFNVISYFGGVSAVSLRDYAISLLAILPGTVLYVFLGVSAEQLAENAMMMSMDDTTDDQHMTRSRKITIAAITIGVVLGVGTICLTTRYARRELRRILDEREEASAEEIMSQDSLTPADESLPSTDSRMVSQLEEGKATEQDESV